MEHGAEIEVVVVVAHRQVAPARQFLAQVVGTDPVRQRHLAQPRLVQPARLHGGGAGRRQAFVEALGQGTGLAVAGLVRVLAGLVPRHQFQHPHRQSAGLPLSLIHIFSDLTALGERIKLLQEEIAAKLNEQNNRILFTLTMVTVLALPINIVAGFFGMNVGGIPFADDPEGFWIMLVLVASFTFLAGRWAFRKRGDY